MWVALYIFFITILAHLDDVESDVGSIVHFLYQCLSLNTVCGLCLGSSLGSGTWQVEFFEVSFVERSKMFTLDYQCLPD